MKVTGTDAMWGGRFEASPSEFTQVFGASLPVDQRMWRADIAGSVAHSAMLGKQGVISQEDVDAIHKGLEAIGKRIEAGEFEFDINDEDIHMSIERNLTEAIGAAGGRLHTGRSRNDQVATDAHLHCKGLAQELIGLVNDLRAALLEVADANFGVVMPGYTHMQKAQPVLFSHHLLAYYWMFTRDCTRLTAARDAADCMPLGSAALAGTTFPLDRAFTAEQLGFAGVYPNSMDAVSDRDFLLDLSYACSVTMMHLSRLCEEIIYWSSDEFRFIRLSDAYSTGSSIMPQKKNPDFAELIRGKTGRVYGDLVQLLTVMKALPLAYNKDMQEDKEGVFDAVDTLGDSLVVMTGMIRTMTVNADRMRAGAHGGFMAATDLADYLVGKGMPFRDAHAVVGKLVLDCEKAGKTLQELTVADLQAADPLFDEGAVEAVDIDQVVAKRTTQGGTGHDAVKAQLELAKQRLAADQA
ncbi:MAG: argininosuccinate lyase [Coriobacteriia bacterium]|nr:argininosuccinate lyase [Coriobacteriia bacterium]